MSAGPARPGSSSPDGFGPDSLGHRVPAVRLPAKLAIEILRLTAGTAALMPEEKLVALLRTLADRLSAARQNRDSGEGQIRYSWHAGMLRAVRSNADELL